MIVVYTEFECMLYEGQSLKEKRSVIKRMTTKLRSDFNVSVAELDFHDLWQRTKLGVVTISNEKQYAEKIIQDVLRMIDSFPEIERTITRVERL